MTPDGEALLVSGSCPLSHTHFTVLVSNPIQQVSRVALPLVVAWVDFEQTAPEGEAFLVNRQRPKALIEVVAIDIIDGDVAFPSDAVRVGCKLIRDGKRLLTPNSCG